jgi:hypothetical protein
MNEQDRLEFAQLLDWLEGRLPEEAARRVAEQLPGADQATQADLAWLRSFLQGAQDLRRASPPSQVRETLRQHFADFAQARRPPGFFRRLIAGLTFESLGQSALAGARSAAGEGLQRQLIYSTEAAEVVLNIRPSAGGRTLSLSGQVFPTSGLMPETFTLQLLQESLEVALAEADDLGEFAFQAVPAGEYELVLSAPEVEIVVPSVLLQA